jgi:hypothetical protein
MQGMQYQGGRFVQGIGRAVPEKETGFRKSTGGESNIVAHGNEMLDQAFAVHG